MPVNLRKTQWKSKACDICGESERLTPLGERIYNQPTRSCLHEFQLHDVVCESCGFVFAGRIPDDDFLCDYYREAHTLQSEIKRIEPDFNPEARLKIIREFVPIGASIYEIGASTGEFCAALNEEGYLASGIDPLEKSSDSVAESGIFETETDFAPPKKFDAAASYYVLEHVTHPRTWLDHIRRFLKPNGILITEVPDFTRCPDEALFPEHMCQFTPFHLGILLRSMGFEVLKNDRESISRDFGFVTVARALDGAKVGYPVLTDLISVEELKDHIVVSKRSYRMGIESRKSREDRYRALGLYIEERVENLHPRGSTIYFWPANDIAGSIAGTLSDTNRVIALDNSSTKIGAVYPGFINPVQAPDLKTHDPNHRIFILCSPSWNNEIDRQIRELNLEDTTIIDGVSWKPSEDRL